MKFRIFIAVIILGGCAVGPDYKRPETAAPAQYKELAGWRQAQPRDAAPRGPWWALFGEPELDALMKRVEVSNQTIRAADARLRQARAVADQARAGLFPTVSATGSATRSKSPSLANAPTTSRAVNTFSATGNASWELDLWGKVRRSIESGEASWQASAADLEAARLSVRASLAQNYFALRVAASSQKMLEDTVAAYQRSLEMTKNRYAAGVVARVDVVQAEVQLKSAQAQLIDVGVERAQLEHAVALLVGEAPANFSLAPAPISAMKMPGIPIGLPSDLLERRPDIAAAERSVAAANAQIGVAKAAYFPSLTLSGAAGYRSSDAANLFNLPHRLWSLGASATQSVFDGGRLRAVTAEKVAAYDAEVADYRQAVLTGFQEVEDNLAALRILEEEAQIQDEVVQAARHALELTLNQYKAGVVSYLNVISAQATALSNERAAAAILGRRLTAATALVKALGGGWSSEALPR